MDPTAFVIPCLLAGVALYALTRRVDVYAALTQGAGEGLTVVAKILPALVGLLIRHLTRSDNLGYGVGLGLMAVTTGFFLLDSSAFEGLLPDIMKKLSLFDRLETFVNGVFDITGVVYFLSVGAFFLFLTVQSLEKRRYN